MGLGGCLKEDEKRVRQSAVDGLQSNKGILCRMGEPGLQVAVENKRIINAASL